MPQDDADSLSYVNSPSIFIGGCGRSGTALMQGLICNSRDTIDVTAESTYFRELIAAFDIGYRSQHNLDYFDSNEDLIRLHREMMEIYLRHVCLRFGPGKILVQKSPTMTRYFAHLSVLMPNARFIFMMRDIRDYIASRIVHLEKRKTKFNLKNSVKTFIDQHEHIRRNRRVLKGKLIHVRYERLVYYPNETLGEIARFLNVSLEDNVSDTTWLSKRSKTDPSASALDGQPVSRSRVGRYRRALDENTLEQIEDMMPEISRRIGMDCFSADDPDDRDRFPNTELLV